MIRRALFMHANKYTVVVAVKNLIGKLKKITTFEQHMLASSECVEDMRPYQGNLERL